jgi:hypothetical protein
MSYMPENSSAHPAWGPDPAAAETVQVPIGFRPPGPPAPGRGPGHGRRFALTAVLAAAALGGGLLAYQLTPSKQLPAPEAVVAAYFQDLESGQAAAAAALATGPYQGAVVSSPRTLANPSMRPSDFTIVSSAPDNDAQISGESAAYTKLTYVSVRYRVDGAEQSEKFVAEYDTGNAKWLLLDPYVPLNVDAGSPQATVLVDGVSAALGNEDYLDVFPGEHVLAEPTPAYVAPDEVTVAKDPSGQGQISADTEPWTVRIPDQKLSRSGQAEADAAVAKAMDQCAEQASGTGSDPCGLGIRATYVECTGTTWEIITQPQVYVELGVRNPDGSYGFATSGGTAAESGQCVNEAGSQPTLTDQLVPMPAIDGNISFESDGTASATTGS